MTWPRTGNPLILSPLINNLSFFPIWTCNFVTSVLFASDYVASHNDPSGAVTFHFLLHHFDTNHHAAIHFVARIFEQRHSEPVHNEPGDNVLPILPPGDPLPAGDDPGPFEPDDVVAHCALPICANSTNIFAQIVVRPLSVPVRPLPRVDVPRFRVFGHFVPELVKLN
uniref:Uncharacterized protein n=1 Tax=Globodera rostochiensis TaxID=31243 RepID=A0A914I115_GLORO